MPDYSKGKIYKIVSDSEPDKVYIGSTIQPLYKRLGGHVKDYKRFLDGKSNYITSFDLLKNNDYQILLIENVSCESKEELCKKEGEYIRKYKNNDELEECINKRIEGRTQKEYSFDNKDKIKDKWYIKVNCEYCNKLSSMIHLKRHQQSKKCLSFQ